MPIDLSRSSAQSSAQRAACASVHDFQDPSWDQFRGDAVSSVGSTGNISPLGNCSDGMPDDGIDNPGSDHAPTTPQRSASSPALFNSGSACSAAAAQALREAIGRALTASPEKRDPAAAFRRSGPPAEPPTAPAATGALRNELVAQYGAAHVDSRLAHDVFENDQVLKRQLAHETKTGITLRDYAAIGPVGALPEGWHAQDRISTDAGLTKVRTTLTGPDGESGMIVRSFDGATLYLDKAYKSTLPTRLASVPGFDQPVATINYLTARACRLLGVSPDNLQQIKVNRLQHRATLAHMDWLGRHHPEKSMSELIGHTTWARSYIRETADIFGHALQPEPRITRQGSPEWIAAHPGAPPRSWDYMTMETERLTVKHLTGSKLPRVDDPGHDWRKAAGTALAAYRDQRCAGLDDAAAAAEKEKIDALLAGRLAAIRHEDTALCTRYDLSPAAMPQEVNFDVTFRTAPSSLPAPLP